MGYIAPEQLQNAKKADQRSDIYSLAITLMCLASGSPPISSTYLLEQCSELLGSDLQRILMRATLESPDMRTQTMDAFYKQLMRIPEPESSQVSLYIALDEKTKIATQKTLPVR
jgi:serine/threonine protein kinase